MKMNRRPHTEKKSEAPEASTQPLVQERKRLRERPKANLLLFRRTRYRVQRLHTHVVKNAVEEIYHDLEIRSLVDMSKKVSF